VTCLSPRDAIFSLAWCAPKWLQDAVDRLEGTFGVAAVLRGLMRLARHRAALKKAI
jgi:hypothetical protein